MGNVSSRPDDGSPLYLRDQSRLTISSLSITNQRRKTLLNVVPNGFPATRVSAIRDLGDSSVVEYVQDPDTLPGAAPNFLLKVNNDEELIFNFTFIIRQSQGFLLRRVAQKMWLSPSPPFHLVPPPKLRLPSSQSLDSRVSGQELSYEDAPPSPNPLNLDMIVPPIQMADIPKVDVSCQRPGEDMSATEDGPLFRATMKALEQKTGNMRTRMKKVLRKAEAAQIAQINCNDAIGGFMEALREASNSNANAVQPALDHYFDKIAREILQKKRAESDTKYQTKRRNFELKRFDYSSFMQDLHGGRKEQEVLSHLTKYADAQTRSYLAAAKKVEQMLPQLEALSAEVQDADKEFQYQRTAEREEKRRNLEKSTVTYVEPETIPAVPVEAVVPGTSSSGNGTSTSDSELKHRIDSTGYQLRPIPTNSTTATVTNGGMTEFTRSPGSLSSVAAGTVGSPVTNPRFRGIRDLEEKDHSQITASEKLGTQRKEGLLWALSRPGSHVDPRGLNKQAWHKFWIVLDAGKLSEYSNWKQRLDLHMEPIDLRMASVREARDAERRFCFEVITPQYKRVYQATSEEDMKNWISAINNALQSAVEGRGMRDYPTVAPQPEAHSIRRDIGSILTGKSSSMNHGHSSNHNNTPNTNNVFRRTTVGARPAYGRSTSSSFDESPDKLLQLLRETDQGNSLKANPNVTDKSRGTHSVFLALAAADPASPAQGTSSTRAEPPAKIVPFPIAEMLVQHGAEIPTVLPAFPLSRSATLYIEQKTQRGGSTSDTVGALPTTMTPQEKLKEREARLQKRVSAGGRLAKTPIQERS
ncbi:hypothetical protein EYC84_006499 [Monilinia fructicola]|uniref:ADP-ribosylation factor GTPase-activating protein n=1 Tax=Monilinia fructicola TaxID=38448 RepID=A0A5M9K821_MONFR|nr:hypothetical protein EYC84_006499 [Monilinia fructicola]